MAETHVTIQNKAGLHARPSSMIVKIASKYMCEIYIGTKNNMVNAKSIMGVMTLGAGYGTDIVVRAEGDNEENAIQEIKLLFDNKFTSSD